MSPWLTPKTGKARRPRRAVGCEGADATAAAEDYSSLERVAVKFAGSMNADHPLVVPLGRRLVAAWIAAEDPNVAAPSAIRLDVEPTEPILAAIGSASRGVSGFRESHREAIHARRVARLSGRRNGTVTRYEDVALTALTSVDMDLARRFVARELGPLAAQDDDTQRLAATLRVYLEEHCGPRRAAQRLGVHENTIKGRVRAINELLGRAASERVGELLVALRLARLTNRDKSSRYLRANRSALPQAPAVSNFGSVFEFRAPSIESWFAGWTTSRSKNS